MSYFKLIDKKELAEVEDIFNNWDVIFRYGFDQKRNNNFKVKQFENEFDNKVFLFSFCLGPVI